MLAESSNWLMVISNVFVYYYETKQWKNYDYAFSASIIHGPWNNRESLIIKWWFYFEFWHESWFHASSSSPFHLYRTSFAPGSERNDCDRKWTTKPFPAASERALGGWALVGWWMMCIKNNEHRYNIVLVIINIEPLFAALAALIYFRHLIQSCSWLGIEVYRGGGHTIVRSVERKGRNSYEYSTTRQHEPEPRWRQ